MFGLGDDVAEHEAGNALVEKVFEPIVGGFEHGRDAEG